jgi:CHAD domain-containing protein
MRALRGFTVVLLGEVDAIDQHWAGTVSGDDPEALHDLRIAVRRTRCVLREGRRVLPQSLVQAARQQFGRLADLTGPPRDLDVLAEVWPQYTVVLDSRGVAAIRGVGVLIEQQREEAHVALSAGFDEATRSRLDAWREWLESPIAGDHATRRLGRVVARRVDQSHARIVEQGRLIERHSPDAMVHDLRKEAKTLRYLLECFDELFVDEPRDAVVRRLKDVQDALGEHQDAVAHHAVIAAASERVSRPSAATRAAVAAVLRELDRSREVSRDAFVEQFASFDSKATRAALRHATRDLAG